MGTAPRGGRGCHGGCLIAGGRGSGAHLQVAERALARARLLLDLEDGERVVAAVGGVEPAAGYVAVDVDGVRVLGTSGQPIDDMQRYNLASALACCQFKLSLALLTLCVPTFHRSLPGDDRLHTLQRTLEFQHLAPTAPDTLGCYPFADRSEDPFMIRTCPHIYFAGNQPRFESTLVEDPAGQRVRCILVPDFQVEHTCVLVNLRTLECRPMSFSGLSGGAVDMSE